MHQDTWTVAALQSNLQSVTPAGISNPRASRDVWTSATYDNLPFGYVEPPSGPSPALTACGSIL